MKSMHSVLAWITILAAGAAAGSIDSEPVQYKPAELTRAALSPITPPAAQAAKGHYQHLLKKFEVAADRTRYGDFYDFGYWSGASYGGQENLPAGFWVYLAPDWYIFQDAAETAVPVALTPRPWGPEQATGAPDTWPKSGDITTAWASATPDGQREWLELTYDAPVRPAAVLIYETYNPGAVDRVTGYDSAGKEVELWSGTDPTPVGQEKGISVIPVHPDFDLSRVRIYLDSPKVPGWNEIDAVGLLDTAGVTHWAKSATASSSYADREQNPGILNIYETDRLSEKR